jgi:signal transduction histidine kinase
MRLSGDEERARTFARALGLVFNLARGRASADRATAQLLALEQAVRGISGVLDHERVLQLIVDRVRELASAEYAALGIVDSDGVIEQFITSGITDAERERIGALPRGRGLLGLIIRESRSYRIADIGSHPESFGFPPEHPPMESFLGVPVVAQGSAVGRLYLTNKRGATEFTAEDQALVEMFALHAGIAIENARLHQQVQRLAIVDERDRISRDLHDGVIQAIYAQTLALDDVPDLMEENADEARERVDAAIDALHAVIRDLRNFIFGLRPVLLESGSLTDGLQQLAAELRRNGGVDVTAATEAEGATDDLPIEIVAELLAITREALANIARHAAATTATVALGSTREGLRLEIADDGRGFDAERAAAQGHHGLANMRARAGALGGRLAIDSGDAGTRIIITLPRQSVHRRGDE